MPDLRPRATLLRGRASAQRRRARAARPAEGDELFPPHQAYPPEDDGVDESSEESFPASDAPSTWSRSD